MLTSVDFHYQEIAEDFSLPVPEDIEHIPTQDILAVYFRQSGHVQLLSAQEEVALAQRIRSGKYARMVLEEHAPTTALPERLLAALHELSQAAQLAREALARANIRLVVSIAKRYREGALPFADLIQEGNIGLMLAVDRFNPVLGNRFSTYATYWIHQAIRRGMARTSRTIRLPQDADDLLRQIYAAREALRQESGQEPGVQEIGKHLNITSREVETLLVQASDLISLNAASSGQAEIGDFLEDRNTAAPEEEAHAALMTRAIEQTLESTLTGREAEVIRMRFGLRDGIAQTLDEVGAVFHLSKERIRQIESAALEKLRQSQASRHLYEYILEE